MKKEDIKFLKELQNEMRTQVTDYQASPRYWTIMQEEKEYWVDDSIDGIFIYSNDDAECLFEGEECSKEFKAWLGEFVKERTYQRVCFDDVCTDLSFEVEEKEYYIDGAVELESFLNEFCDCSVSVGYYRKVDKVMPNTFFLTKRECEHHLRMNKHHYNETAHTYAMTAWRSPQVARLYEVLENTNWDEVKEE
ncbi:hypothetical protein [uncultured Clostridium sp.]|jgi:hypothetical protein|uniref:hypothetical protein n=1 Tax=uncultured Clostridium sp. TaxID=59620 RepID=UPI002631C60B|nr:hypothetical protein [uncultured Clostridium sp.]